MKNEKIIVTQIKSSIGYHSKQKLTLLALGLKKVNQSVEKINTPQIAGMVKKIQHLVSIKEA